MKTIVKSALTILLGTIFSGSIIVAQEKTQTNQPRPGTKMTKPALTEEQKAMLKNDFQKRKEIREAFKATLTQEQKNMLTDPRMMKTDRIKALRASLTDQQVNIIKTRQQEMRVTKNQLKSNMSTQQKMQFKKMAANTGRMDKAVFKRARLRNKKGGI